MYPVSVVATQGMNVEVGVNVGAAVWVGIRVCVEVGGGVPVEIRVGVEVFVRAGAKIQDEEVTIVKMIMRHFLVFIDSPVLAQRCSATACVCVAPCGYPLVCLNTATPRNGALLGGLRSSKSRYKQVHPK